MYYTPWQSVWTIGTTRRMCLAPSCAGHYSTLSDALQLARLLPPRELCWARSWVYKSLPGRVSKVTDYYIHLAPDTFHCQTCIGTPLWLPDFLCGVQAHSSEWHSHTPRICPQCRLPPGRVPASSSTRPAGGALRRRLHGGGAPSVLGAAHHVHGRLTQLPHACLKTPLACVTTGGGQLLESLAAVDTPALVRGVCAVVCRGVRWCVYGGVCAVVCRGVPWCVCNVVYANCSHYCFSSHP